MSAKSWFIIGGLVGYVLGARAGRGAYNKIASRASRLWGTDPVQRGLDLAKDRARDIPVVGATIADAVGGVAKKVDAAAATKAG